jgi:hypothetical protein
MTTSTLNVTRLTRAIEFSENTFELSIGLCDSESLKEDIIRQVQYESAVPVQVLELTSETQGLLKEIVEYINSNSPQALIIIGFEEIQDLDSFWYQTNAIREHFSQESPIPQIWLMKDSTYCKFTNFAPSFSSIVIPNDFN